MADLQKYVDWNGLNHYDSKIKQFIKDKFDSCFKFGGAISFEELPLPDEEELNFVYQITNEFISDSRFDVPKKSYEPGALVYVVKTAEDLYKFSILIESSKVDTDDIIELNNGLKDLENQVSKVKTIVETLNTTKQDKLVSGESLATINGKSLLDGGNIDIEQKDLVCTIDKETEFEVGGIPVGTNLNGWTYSQIIQRMFFRPLTDIIVDTTPVMIEGAYATVYTGVSTSSSYVASETNILEENPSKSKTFSYTDEGLYKIYSADGTLQETGFQVSVQASGRGAYSQVVMNVQPVKVMTYTDFTGWVEYNGTWDLVKTTHIQSSTGEILTYYVFQNSDTSSAEEYYRFVF